MIEDYLLSVSQLDKIPLPWGDRNLHIYIDWILGGYVFIKLACKNFQCTSILIKAILGNASVITSGFQYILILIE